MATDGQRDVCICFRLKESGHKESKKVVPALKGRDDPLIEYSIYIRPLLTKVSSTQLSFCPLPIHEARFAVVAAIVVDAIIVGEVSMFWAAAPKEWLLPN